MRVSTRWSSAAALAAVVTVLLIALSAALPRTVSAGESRAAFDPWTTAARPEERALTGGVVRLTAPRSTMILVLGGTFRMGSTPMDGAMAALDCEPELQCKPDWFENEQPAHHVRLRAFWMDRTEVTVADYRRCVELKRCEPAGYHEGTRRFERPTHPVSLITWRGAAEYCAFRGARLPLEAEFERAARGLNGRRYPWGNLYNSRAANHGRAGGVQTEESTRLVLRTDSRDGFSELAPVGSLPHDHTPEGFLDLGGNVSEWTRDAYEPYPPDAGVVVRDVRSEDDLTGSAVSKTPAAALGASRVRRGGDYETGAPWLRSAARREVDPRAVLPTLGFRCARTARGLPRE